MILRNLPRFPDRPSSHTRWSRALLAVSFAASSVLCAETAPTPLPTPLTQNFGTTTFTTLPSGFAAWSGLSGATISSQALAEASAPTADATLSATSAAQTTGGAYGYATASDGKFYIQTSSNTASGVNQLAMAVNCSAKQDVVLGYAVEVLSAQPRTVGVVCQYRVGSSGAWTTVTTNSGLNPYSQAGGTVGLKTTVSANLPAAVNNQSVVQVRWATWRGTETGSSSGLAIDNISVSASPFGGPDTIPPEINSLSPANNATGVAVGSNLAITFDEVVSIGTGNFVIKKTSDNSVVATIPVGDPGVSGFGTTTVTVNPASDLAPSTGYYVQIDSGAIKDGAGNSFTGISSNSTWTFTTLAPDATPPTVVSFLPTNTATNVALASALEITFNEAIQVPVLSGPMITVKKTVGGTTVATIDPSLFAGTGNVSITGAVATITMPQGASLEYGTSYYLEIDLGAFEDTSSNPFSGFTGSSVWGFSTTDVPALTGTPYTQSFASYTSAATLPPGWSATGATGYLSSYVGDWGSTSVGGFRGNASVYGYHHTSASVTTDSPMEQILTLRNKTGATLTNLTVTYKGRMEIPANTRLPAYSVTIADVPVSALSYSTSDGDNAQRNASVGGLSIPNDTTFQIKWSSRYPSGTGSARQIGISDVSVSASSSTFAPTLAGISVPVATIASTAATANANVLSDGGQTVTARGFVYSITSVNPAPQIGGSGVTLVSDASQGVGAFSANFLALTSSTVYTVRAYATNTTGTSYGTAATFTTSAASPTLVSNYSQEFNNYDGTNPAGWTAVSDASPPIQTYAGTWGQGSTTGGFLGGVSAPGSLGYRHTSSTGNLTVTLRLFNGTGATLNTLNVSYLGRAKVSATSPEGRSPKWAVSINGSSPVPALAYDTASGVDTTISTTLSGLSIAAGAEFTISWTSDRDLTGSGSSKQIGISQVLISTSGTSGYSTWATANVGGEASTGDFDKDGVANGLEYFMGTTSSGFTTNPGIVGGKITWPKAPDFAGTYSVQTSPDLVNWTNVLSTVVGNSVEYTPTGSGKIFVRMQVVVTP